MYIPIINTIRKRARMDKNDQTQVPDLNELLKEQFQHEVRNESIGTCMKCGNFWPS